MERLKFSLSILLVMGCLLTSCRGQEPAGEESNRPSAPRVGGPFENSEFGLIGQPAEVMSADTSPGWNQAGQKLLITGTIFAQDGKTPVAGAILYYYHTNTAGFYEPSTELDPRVRRHGYIRGWVKSDVAGNYAIYTVRPGAYPNSSEPAHIHPSVYEPGLDDPYYLDAFVFDDDPLLTTAKRRRMTNRGGSGVLRMKRVGELEVARHDIILGLNIPGYPTDQSSSSTSGPAIGEDLFSFRPYHAWGKDQDTRTCPICKYGKNYGVLCFIGPGRDPAEWSEWLRYFNSAASLRADMKVFFVFADQPAEALQRLGQRLDLNHVALTTVPSFRDTVSEIDHYGLDPESAYTLLIYRHSNVIDRYQGASVSALPAQEIEESLDRAGGEIFPAYLPD